VLLVIALLLVAALSALSIVNFLTSSNAPSQLGPYQLAGSTDLVSLTFPNCSRVVVNWQVTSGERANFSVLPPPEIAPSSCSGPPPSNATCPPTGCTPGIGEPVCFEAGFSGNCSFTATQAGYDFVLWAPHPDEVRAVVSFTASYS
jgi:hypothetical protein